MKMTIQIPELIEAGLSEASAKKLLSQIENLILHCDTSEQAWDLISTKILSSLFDFKIHLILFSSLFPNWHSDPESAPAWLPKQSLIESSNISHFMSTLNIKNVKDLHQWTISHIPEFWQYMIKQFNIPFKKNPDLICDLTRGVTSPNWLPGAKLNISDSCFTAPDNDIAIYFEDLNKNNTTYTYKELNQLSNRVANSLITQKFMQGDAIGIAMPMNPFAIAIYLGIIKMGGVVVSIADSFSSEEIATRLEIANAKAMFTQDFINWEIKKIPLYEKIEKCRIANHVKIIVIPCDLSISIPLRKIDMTWKNFLIENDQFTSVACDPMSPCNILFSSGTTGTPKAIIWNHTTPIKVASDAYFHQNIQPGDICTWPTNLGWMMGPWLIFATFINHASIAIYAGAPKDKEFGEFIQRNHVTMLGLVPTLIATWRETKCMEKCDWSSIKVFSSTGECSNPEDMLYLMSLAGYKPIIEYCGGTEIGGAYVSSTVIENNYPSLFSTPTMGLDFTILNDHGKAAKNGEVAIIPPSIGLSTELINANHHQVYYSNMPKSSDGKVLRRHGDQLQKFPQGHYSILGRVDDTMNLGGIKISAVEIERALAGLPHIIETAAIAISPPNNGPSLLIIYAATTERLDKNNLQNEMQKKINAALNPLFKIYDVILTPELPKTASNKIMRRILRKQYQQK